MKVKIMWTRGNIQVRRHCHLWKSQHGPTWIFFSTAFPIWRLILDKNPLCFGWKTINKSRLGLILCSWAVKITFKPKFWLKSMSIVDYSPILFWALIVFRSFNLKWTLEAEDHHRINNNKFTIKIHVFQNLCLQICPRCKNHEIKWI